MHTDTDTHTRTQTQTQTHTPFKLTTSGRHPLFDPDGRLGRTVDDISIDTIQTQLHV